MNFSFLRNSVAAVSLACFAPALHGSAVFSDTFDSGTGAWHKAYNNANTTLTHDSGRLSFAPGAEAGGYEVIGRSFPTQTTGVGETVTLTFDFRQTSATGILRFGLYDRSAGAFGADDWANTSGGTYAGYTTFIRDNVVEVNESTPPVVDEVVRYSNDQYQFRLNTLGFRHAFEDAAGKPVASAHAESGLLLGLMAGATPTVSPVQSTVIDEFEGDRLRATVTTANGVRARVEIEFHESYARFKVAPLGQPADARFTFDFRTAPMRPVYGLGDFGSHTDAFNDVTAPCNGNVGARDQADLTGFVRNEITNQGSCRRFVTNFAIFPKQGFAQVLFNDAKKRVGFTPSENRIGVADVTEVKTLYYFTGSMERIYADYLAARVREGYPDVKPRYPLFNVGWEAYGALGWNTFQEAVMDNIQTYLEKGFPLKWGVVGSGFWPGNRSSTSQGTTVSFGMWDSAATPRSDGLPNPRYPDPAALKQLFRD
ncbi:MAG: hypothetical protein MUF04_07640, partial [Akkermansiaceae bacterium]|nr:hypothetical protein [Akkermansiaceae bacterium]